MLEKKALRQRLLKEREAISSSVMEQWSQDIVAQLRAHLWFEDAKVVYAYRSFRQEIALAQLFHHHTQDKVWGFPRCKGKEMVWHSWAGQAGSEFCLSRYGIEEPFSDWPVAPTPDLILVPTVACDRRGYRLGYGGGFYDRMLVNLDSTRTKTIGILPNVFLQDELPIDPWDQPLDAICTETGFIELLKGAAGSR